MNRKLVSLALLMPLACVAACKKSHRPEGAIEMKMPTGTPNRPQGMPALTVKAGPVPFTKEEVTRFIQTHHLARSIGDISRLQVESLDFMTAREVTARLQGASTGLPDDDRVAFATIRGPIYFTGPPGSRTIAFDTAYALFDTATGNLLMSGTLEKSKKQPESSDQATQRSRPD